MPKRKPGALTAAAPGGLCNPASTAAYDGEGDASGVAGSLLLRPSPTRPLALGDGEFVGVAAATLSPSVGAEEDGEDDGESSAIVWWARGTRYT